MKKSLFKRIANTFLSLLARFLIGATTTRVYLHRLRGVKITGNVFIGEDVLLENEYPERVEIQDGVMIAMRCIIMAHFLGPGRIIIKCNAWIGPNSVISTSEGRTVTIGEGAVIGAGSVVTQNVPDYTFVSGVPAKSIAKVTTPVSQATNYNQFLLGLKPIKKKK